MEAVCKGCGFVLKLPKTVLPAGARLFCPKCRAAMEINEGTGDSFVVPVKKPAPRRTPGEPQPEVLGQEDIIEVHHDEVVVEAAEKAPESYSLQMPAGDGLFSEDLKPEVEAPAVDSVQISLDAIASDLPQEPPVLPQARASQDQGGDSGYIKATQSIHVDSSMFAKETPGKSPQPARSKNVSRKNLRAPAGEMETLPPLKDQKTDGEAGSLKPVAPIFEEPKKNHTGMIIALIVAVVAVSAAVVWFLSARVPQEPRAPQGVAQKQAAQALTPVQEHYSLANKHFQEGRYQLAAQEYREAIKFDGSFPNAYRDLGATYAKLGKPELAIEYYEQYLKLAPAAADAAQVKKIVDEYNGK
jgi:TolA-binding protein